MGNDKVLMPTFEEMVQRSEKMEEALENLDIRSMVDIFTQEQMAHMYTLASLADDVDDKIHILEKAVVADSRIRDIFSRNSEGPEIGVGT